MTNDRLKTLLIACLYKFYDDYYDKDRIMEDVGMKSTEYDELMHVDEPWSDGWSNPNDCTTWANRENAFEVGARVAYINKKDAGTTYYPPLGTRGTVLACEGDGLFVEWDVSMRGDTRWYCRAMDVVEVKNENNCKV